MGLADGSGKMNHKSVVNMSSAFVAPLSEVQCCRSGKSAYFLKMQNICIM